MTSKGGQRALVPDTADSDRRAVVATMVAERKLGRILTEMAYNNRGFDIESVDPQTAFHFFLEVKGHKPTTATISVSASLVQKVRRR